ncbi:MAG: hypothetical protein QM711_16885 [Micropruina sp.]|uniref:hypothetical protein n=1 Tax=Micropruina sp. TaxID=2737536 RepID=UPI0039E2FF9E
MELVLPSLEEQRALLTSLRPRTATLEWVVRRGVSPEPLDALLDGFDTERTVGIGPRPGYPKPDRDAAVLVSRAHRDLFARLAENGLFTVEHDSRGDRVSPTGLGFIDVGFLDDRKRLICSTVTHAGIIHLLNPDD